MSTNDPGSIDEAQVFDPEAWPLAKSERWLVGGIALGLAIVSVAPFLGHHVYLPEWDFLDSLVSWRKLLAEEGARTAGSIGPSAIMSGNAFLESRFTFPVLMTRLVGPLGAIAVNEVLTRVVAFVGMALLLRHVVFGGLLGEGRRNEDEGAAAHDSRVARWLPMAIVLGCAVAFSLLPLWRPGSLGVATQPLELLAFLRLRAGSRRWIDAAILVLGPAFGMFVFSGLFLLALLGAVTVWDLVKGRARGRLLLVLAGMVLVTGLVEWDLFAVALTRPRVVSHRVEMDWGAFDGFTGARAALSNALKLALQGQEHVPTIHALIVLPTVLLGLVAGRSSPRARNALALALALVAVVASTRFFFRFSGTIAVLSHLGPLRGVQLDRFYVFFPLLWYGAFAIALLTIARTWHRVGAIVALGALALQGAYVLKQDEPLWAFLRGKTNRTDYVAFDRFYASPLFEQVKTLLGDDAKTARVASLGMHPSVAQYNGLSTIDGYSSLYRVEYKHEFRVAIQRELEKNSALAEYFDGYGSRCYLFDDQVGRNFDLAYGRRKTQRLDLDHRTLDALGAKYIVSAAEVLDLDGSGLRLLGVPAAEGQRLFVYEILPPASAMR